jgi:hypothetical protein
MLLVLLRWDEPGSWWRWATNRAFIYTPNDTLVNTQQRRNDADSVKPKRLEEQTVLYSSCRHVARFKVAEELHPLFERGSKSNLRSLVQRYTLCYAASPELFSLARVPLYVLQCCTLLLWPWSMQFGDAHSCATSHTTNPTCIDLGANSGLCGEKPTNNQQSYGPTSFNPPLKKNIWLNCMFT